ncbi:hypothetical protein BC828DRAFT_437292 [Blastocladiella britannica]|nr:hypothetical protein BC828DRAFT_437292 [Blastocladiella britannica]
MARTTKQITNPLIMELLRPNSFKKTWALLSLLTLVATVAIRSYTYIRVELYYHRGGDLSSKLSSLLLEDIMWATFWFALTVSSCLHFAVIFRPLQQSEQVWKRFMPWMGFGFLLAVIRPPAAQALYQTTMAAPDSSDYSQAFAYWGFGGMQIVFGYILTPLYIKWVLRRLLAEKHWHLVPLISPVSVWLIGCALSIAAWFFDPDALRSAIELGLAITSMVAAAVTVAFLLYHHGKRGTSSKILGHFDLAWLAFTGYSCAFPGLTWVVPMFLDHLNDIFQHFQLSAIKFIIPSVLSFFMTLLTLLMERLVPLLYPRNPDLWMIFCLRVCVPSSFRCCLQPSIHNIQVASELFTISTCLTTLNDWPQVIIFCLCYMASSVVFDLKLIHIAHTTSATRLRQLSFKSLPSITVATGTVGSRKSTMQLLSVSGATGAAAVAGSVITTRALSTSSIPMVPRTSFATSNNAIAAAAAAAAGAAAGLTTPNQALAAQQRYLLVHKITVAQHSFLARTLALLAHLVTQLFPPTTTYFLYVDPRTSRLNLIAVIGVLVGCAILAWTTVSVPWLRRECRIVNGGNGGGGENASSASLASLSGGTPTAPIPPLTTTVKVIQPSLPIVSVWDVHLASSLSPRSIVLNLAIVIGFAFARY